MTLPTLLAIEFTCFFVMLFLSELRWRTASLIMFFYLVSIFGALAYAEDSTPLASSPGKRSTALFPSYYEEAGRGRHWYQTTPPPPKEQKPEPEPASPPLPVPAPLTPREILQKQGEAWEDALARAVLHPSAENYLEYLRLTAAIQAQAQQFAMGFRQAIWSAPEYDYTLVNPVRAEAISAKNQAALIQETADLTALADRYGLVFFLRGDCPYCQRFAPVLKAFTDAHGFSVLPVSLDGKGLPEFPDPQHNALLASKLQVDVVPTVFLVDPVRDQLLPVSYGFTDASTLAKKILWAADNMKNDKNK
ncbi:MAG: conjugal transfer protein TraF [Nitrospira sp.]|nr:conjugal transfer protein TraF [Nitrospira sp.]